MTNTYSTGTVAATAGQKSVTLTGGAALDINMKPGDLVTIPGGSINAIASLTDATHFELEQPFDGETAAGLAYIIFRMPGGWGDRVNLAESVAANIRLLADLLARASIIAYDLSFRFPAAPAASEIMDYLVAGRDFRLPANFAGSQGFLHTPPAAAMTLTLKAGGTLADNGTTLGTVSISTAGAFSFATVGAAAKAVPAGTLLKLIAPPIADIAVSGLALTLFGAMS
jgi:hypothetical protein